MIRGRDFIMGKIEIYENFSESGTEILKLYDSYVKAKAGSEEYTTALQALAEALGLTS